MWKTGVDDGENSTDDDVTETPEQREARLERQREYDRRRCATRTAEQRHDILRQRRERYRARCNKNKLLAYPESHAHNFYPSCMHACMHFQAHPSVLLASV